MSFLYDHFWDDCIEKKKNPIKKDLRKDNIRNRILKAINSSFDFGNYEISINSSCENKNISKKNRTKSLSSRNLYLDSNKKSNYKTLKKNNNCLTSIELNCQKELRDCTFKPNIIKLKKNSKLKQKVDSYIQEPYYKRFKLFSLKQKNFQIQKKTKNELLFNSKYSFKPIINPCLDFNKIRLNQRNEELNYIYYKKMEGVRNKKRKSNEELSTKYTYYGENLLMKNYNDCKTNYKNTTNKIRKSISQKEIINCINDLHSKLMTIKSNIDNNDKKELINQTEIKKKYL